MIVRRRAWTWVPVVAMALVACGDPDAPTGADATIATMGARAPSTPPATSVLRPTPTATTTQPSTSAPFDPAASGTLAAPPATAVFVTLDPNVTVGPLDPVEVTQPCPAGDPFAAGPDLVNEATRLEPMLGRALAYGQAHADVWGSYGLVWLGAGDASVFVSFTQDVDAHRAALVDQVEFPDELIVCQVPITGADAFALQTQLSREFAGRFASIGVGVSGAVEVVLLPGEDQIAAELVERFGDAVSIGFGEVAVVVEQPA